MYNSCFTLGSQQLAKFRKVIVLPPQNFLESLSECALSPPSLPVHFHDADVHFVCGVHKSGTSCLTEMLSKYCFDVSSASNAREMAYGVSVDRYRTYECSTVRQIDNRFMPAFNSRSISAYLRSQPSFTHPHVLAASDFLNQWSVPIVVKNPFFVWSLPRWLVAARSLNRSVAVSFVSRQENFLRYAWLAAPYTHGLLVDGAYEQMRIAYDAMLNFARTTDVKFDRYFFLDSQKNANDLNDERNSQLKNTYDRLRLCESSVRYCASRHQPLTHAVRN